MPAPTPIAVATTICAIAPGNRDLPDRAQVLEREVQSDAEHQQDDADLGELLRERDVRDEAGRSRADEDSRQEVADERRELQPRGEQAQGEGQPEAHSQRRDE